MFKHDHAIFEQLFIINLVEMLKDSTLKYNSFLIYSYHRDRSHHTLGGPMMVDIICLFVVILNDGQKRNLHKWDKLTKNQPDINHSDIGSWWQLFHHTKGYIK